MDNHIPSDYTILMVDDVPENLQVLGSTLREQNYEVEYATNGKEALEWFEKIEFDLVLLDIMMPGIDGFEVCKILRSQKKYDDLPVIFITAKTDTESIIKGFEVGGQDYITKPFDTHELIARVKTHIELKVSKQKLKDTNAWLEQKVNERTAELAEANKDLMSLDSAKSEFLRVINHEIRTPLNGILCGIDVISDYRFGSDMESFLEMLKSSANRLEEFAFRALDISNFNLKGADTLKLEDANIKQVYMLSVAALQKKAEEKNIKINLEYSFTKDIIKIDEKYFGNCVRYLLDNAIKFGNKNSVVNVSVYAQNNKLVTEISDKGIPFPDEYDINKSGLFIGKNHLDHNPGISLFLCKQIIYAHNGSIINFNTEDGASVKFDIPV